MKPVTFTLRVEAFAEDKVVCYVRNAREDNTLRYLIDSGSVVFCKENQMAVDIRTNEHQLRKILLSAIDGKMVVGQIIHCVFLEDFRFLEEENFSRFIRLDRRNGKLALTVSDIGFSGVHKIYADGSCNHQTNQSGYGGFAESPDGTREPFFQSFTGGSSNLMELLAIIDGLRRVSFSQKIQVNTDSRYVIRGLAQWVHFWKHNNWRTAYGRAVRYRKQWRQADMLCEDKWIEFRWIKGHSGDMEQNFCHLLAKAAAKETINTLPGKETGRTLKGCRLN